MNDQLPDSNTIAILGGTGPEGQGLGVRWARSGLRVILGSRDENRARLAAQELAERSGGEVEGMENAAAVAAADVVVLTVPFDAQIGVLKSVASSFRKGAVLISTVVPLATAIHDRSTRLLGVWQGSAAELAAELVPPHVAVVGAFHNVAASLLNSTGPVDCDVIVCSDDSRARHTAFELANRIPGVRPINGGKLENCRIVEAMTALLIGINIRYQVHTAAIRVTGLP
jgi:NADPH-dependent F420 reductase